MKNLLLTPILCLFLFSTGHAAFLGRLPATLGGTDYQAYYDTQLGITWAVDANINGADTWNNQQAWVNSLSIGGVANWRLPNMDLNGAVTPSQVDCAFANVTQQQCMDNEYSHLYHYGAGTTKGQGITSDSSGPFINIQGSNLLLADRYWSSNVFPTAGRAASFHFPSGNQGQSNLTRPSNFAWAVHDGDVGIVPIPAAIWLFGSALGWIGWMRRKRS